MPQDESSFARLQRELETKRRRVAELESSIAEQGVLRAVMDALPYSVMLIDAESFEILLANAPARLPGLGGPTTCHALSHGSPVPCTGDDHPCPIEVIRSTGRPCVLEHLHKDGQGGERNVEIHAAPVFDEKGKVRRIVEICIDITARKKHEAEMEELRQAVARASRLEALGRLAGGVAHDFNNLLTVICAGAALLIKALPEEAESRSMLEDIATAGNRAAELTGQLLAFGQRQILQPRVVDLNRVLEEMNRLLRRTLGEDIRLDAFPAADLWRTRLDPAEIGRVIVNLAINARDAMPHGGVLTLETGNVVLDEAYVSHHAEARAGRHVMLAVSDTGTGIEAGIKDKIFEPFFTTKPAGRGTGLGLATVHGIVKQSGGSIYVYSEPGRGTSFKLYFPVVDAPADPKPAAGSEALLDAPQGETVLLAEDDDAVRALTARILRDAGYTVLEAENGATALEAAADHAGPIALLISDVVMPDLGGTELHAKLLQALPGLEALFVSGYSQNAIHNGGWLAEGIHFLQKPFSPNDLLKRVRAILSD